MTTQLVLAAVLCSVVSFLLAGAESALARVSRVRAGELRDEGRPGSTALMTVVADPAPHLAVTAFLRAIAEALLAVLITLSVTEQVTGFWRTLLVAVGVMAVLSFIVTGVSPRTLGRQRSDRVGLWAAPVVVWLRRLLGPLARLLIAVGNAVTPGRGFRDGPFDSEAELRGLVDLATESSMIEAEERAMIHSVFELGDTLTREVMVPRTDMVSLDSDKQLRSALSLFLRSGFSRIPVLGEDSDDILGILYFKDASRRLNADENARSLPVSQLMRPAHFVPDSKPIDDLLRDMQRNQAHMAVVVDEYGGTAGLVTIEDILEEIVGEIVDEYDREDAELEELADGTTRVDATMDIDDLARHFEVDIEEDEVDTVAGLLAKTIGQVPIVGSTCAVGGLRLTAERVGGRRNRISSVLVERLTRVDARADHDDVGPGERHPHDHLEQEPA